MTITITLTDDDALEYMQDKQIYGSTPSQRRAVRAVAEEQFDKPLKGDQPGHVLTVAELQAGIDAHWAAKGVLPSEEITTTPEEATRILDEIHVGSSTHILPMETTAPDDEPVIDLKSLFGADPTGKTDSTAAFQAAADLFPTTGMTIPVTPVVVPTVMQPSPTFSGPPTIVPIPPSLDVSGLPWDARIHSATKSINKDGTWRVKRGVEDTLIASVTAELKQVMGIPSPVGPTNSITAPTNAPPATPQVLLPLTAEQSGQIPRPPRTEIPPVPAIPFAPAVPAVPVTGAAPTLISDPASSAAVPLPLTIAIGASLSDIPIPPPPAVAAPPTLGFGELIFKITQGVATGSVSQAKVDEVCKEVGLPRIVLIQARPDLIPQVAKSLGIA